MNSKSALDFTRRTLLGAAGAAALSPRASWGRSSKHMRSWSVVEIAKAIADGKITSESQARLIIAAVAANAELNAFATFDGERLLADARKADDDLKRGKIRGPLHGVPLVLKDNIDTVELPTSAGTPALVGNVPKANAPIAERLFAAGAILAGKTNMHELSFGGTSANATFGPVRNPYGLDRVPGGSSGGTAAAVAARLVSAGLGTDTAGSVRVPAALCGVVGLRPTLGRYPSEGIVPLSVIDTAGPIARCVDDIILLDSVMAGRPPAQTTRTPSLVRLGVADRLIDSSTDEVSRAIRAAIEKIASAGVTIVSVDLEPIMQVYRKGGPPVNNPDFFRLMRDYLATNAPNVDLRMVAEKAGSPSVRNRMLGALDKKGGAPSGPPTSFVDVSVLQQAWEDFLNSNNIDAVAMPTTPDVALPLASDDSVIKNGEETSSLLYFTNSWLASVGRRPGITLPVGLSSNGLPVGLELDGFANRDEDLLSVAKVIESVAPGTPAPKI